MGIQVIKSGSVSAYLKLAGNVALTSSLVSVVDQADNVSGLQLATASIGLTMPTFLALPNWTNTLGTKDGFSSQQTVAVASVGTGVFRLIRNAYTINNTAAQTGSVTGYFLNATETALNGITHNLMDLQVGGVSKAKINNIGSQTLAYSLTVGSSSAHYIQLGAGLVFRSPSDGNATLLNNAETSFGRLQLGGTTNLFPAIKRNGANIDFRLADDSGYCDIAVRHLFAVNSEFRNTYIRGNTGTYLSWGLGVVGSCFDSTQTAPVASAILQANSTTQGFLMPRMTQAQILLILTPANGLMVYNTDINTPCFYDGGTLLWKKVSHSNM